MDNKFVDKQWNDLPREWNRIYLTYAETPEFSIIFFYIVRAYKKIYLFYDMPIFLCLLHACQCLFEFDTHFVKFPLKIFFYNSRISWDIFLIFESK